MFNKSTELHTSELPNTTLANNTMFEAQGLNLIDGQWQPGTGQQFTSTCPASNETLWQGKATSEPQLEQAIASARKAFPAWANRPIAERLNICKKFAELIEQYKDDFAQVVHLETGKPLWETATEAASVQGKVGLSIEAYYQRTGFSTQEVAGVTRQLNHRPQGVVGVFGPFNFPAHLPNGHIVPALIAGNTVVFKPSEQTPWVGELMAKIWLAAGLPSGVLQLVQGGQTTGKALAGATQLDGLFFTGSSATGQALHQAAAHQLGKILALELGGNNPLIVYNIKDMQAAVYNTIQSAFISAGQRCTCARRLILPDFPLREKFITELTHAIQQIKLSINSDGSDNRDGFLGPVINNTQADRLMDKQKLLIENGAQPMPAMSRPFTDRPFLTPGLVDVTQCAELSDEEDFGPLLKLIRVDTFKAAIVKANDTAYGLSAGLLSDSQSHWQKFQLNIRAGIVNWNQPTTGASGSAPFGGVGASGNHRPGAFYAADYCAYPVASVYQTQLKLPEKISPGLSFLAQGADNL